MLESNFLDLLKNKKNLLAFSAGVDSTALFFLLLKFDIKFDIAIVNYSLREQSNDEVFYAKELAKKYSINCFVHNAKKINKNFEANARKIRYDFFEKIISDYSYKNLLTAHHLGDRFEWMMMQFCKGAGCAELSGMSPMQNRDNYTIIRPLLNLDKSELLQYLKQNNLKYFIDETNQDENIKRNYFRHQICLPLLKKNLSGIKKSFEYLDEDKNNLITNSEITTIDNFSYFESRNTRSDIYTIDKHLKSLKHIITSNERTLLKELTSLVIGRKYLVVQENAFVFICPYKDEKVVMSKEDKEIFRSLKIDIKLRPYLYKNKKIFKMVKKLFI